MTKRKIFKTAIIIAIAGIVIAGAVGYYMFNMPHRDVQSTKSDFSLTASAVVAEYLTDKDAANQKYLASNGESKILEVTGEVKKISEDFNGRMVVLLKGADDKAGVSATFTAETSAHAEKLQVGQSATIKGVIRSGAAFDSDLELYENVILEKSDLVTK
jgi:RecG-like helicase